MCRFLGSSFTSLGHCDPPLFKVCLHGKQHRHPITTSTATGIMYVSHLQPGGCVSDDQLERSTPGLVPTFQGSPTTASYQADTLFVDYASRYLHFTPHYSTCAQEAVQAKQNYQLQATTFNCKIKSFMQIMAFSIPNFFETLAFFKVNSYIFAVSMHTTRMSLQNVISAPLLNRLDPC